MWRRDSGNSSVVNRYYEDGSLKEVEDAKGNITKYEYNGFKGLYKTIYPDRSEPNDTYEQPSYDQYRRVTQVRGRAGQVIESAYDNLSRVVTKTVKELVQGVLTTVNTVTYEYDLMGRLYQVTDNTGTTKNTYDKAGRLIRVRDSSGNTVSYQYDAGGNRTRLTYPDASYITYEYDQLNRMTAVKNSSGTALASYTYDSRSRRTNLTYANTAYANYSYDAASRLLYVDNQTGNGQHKYAYSYDYVGNRLDMTVTDSSGVRGHLYTYDDIYQITEVNYPDSLSYLATDTTFNYDAAGNRTSVIDGSGTCNYTTNNLNQYTAAGPKSFTYDASGNLTRDGTYEYSYDPENRLTDVTKPNPLQYLNNFSAYTKGGDAPWVSDPSGFAESGVLADGQESWMYIDVSGPGTVRFQWKVSSEESYDYLEFALDGVDQDWISGAVDWTAKSFTVTGSGSHRLRWRYSESGSSADGCAWVKAVTWQPDPTPTLAQAVDSFLTYTTGGSANWQGLGSAGSSWDYAQSGAIGDSQESWMQTTVEGAGTFSFHWTVASQLDCDYLEFYIDSVLQDSISGSVDWETKSYTITGTGTHTLKWRYVKDASDSGGSDRGQVDQVTWTGVIPNDPASDAWQTTMTYVYDPAGRRIEKKYDELTVLKYVYDGDHCIAEYDAQNHLRRKYIYGPAVDEPISLIESTSTYAGTYYYHFDGLGSVTALTNASGTTVEVYEYDVYGRVGASVPAHPNRIMFTGREYDKETGLYYYRARYYNPQIGRFLQTDPVGYGAGMHLYAYCGNNPILKVDPSGKYTYGPDWEYLVPKSTRAYAAGGPWWPDLELFYATGGGRTVWYGNTAANNKFVENDTAFGESMTNGFLDMARVIYYGAYQERGPGDTGIDMVFTLGNIRVDPQVSKTRELMNWANPGVWFDAKITWNENGFTMQGYFLWEDYMDLHPGSGDDPNGDRYWMEWQLWWNTWIRDGLGGPSSEAYRMYMDLGFHSITVVFDPNGNPTIAPGSWLGPSSRLMPTGNQRLELEVGWDHHQNGLWATGVPLWERDGAPQDPESDARERRRWRTVQVPRTSPLGCLASLKLRV